MVLCNYVAKAFLSLGCEVSCPCFTQAGQAPHRGASAQKTAQCQPLFSVSMLFLHSYLDMSKREIILVRLREIINISFVDERVSLALSDHILTF